MNNFSRSKQLPSFSPYAPDTQSEKIPRYILYSFFLYVLFSPVYVLPRGGPQPADFILIIFGLPFMTMLLMNYKGPVKSMYFAGFFFAGWAFVVNNMNFIFFKDPRLALTSLIYGYNFFVFCLVVYIFKHKFETARQLSYYAIIGTIIYEVIIVTFFPDPTYARATGSFPNPNQLGYWTLLTGMMVILTIPKQRVGLVQLLLFLVLFYIAFMTQSKAAIFGHMIFWAVSIFMFPLKPYLKVAVGFVITIIVIHMIHSSNIVYNAYLAFQDTSKLAEHVTADLESTGTGKGETLEERNYFRIMQFPMLSFLGAGEGAYTRWNKLKPNELHSGWATLILSYGIIGTASFSMFMFYVIWGHRWYYILLLTPILFYGVTHQNLRFSHYWLSLGMLYAVKVELNRKREERRRLIKQTI